MHCRQKKYLYSFLAFLLAMSSFLENTNASEDIGSISIYSHSITPQGQRFLIEGDYFLVYQIAYERNGELASTSDFNLFQEQINNKDFVSKITAKSLERFIKENQIFTDLKGITNKAGYLKFSNIKKGIYLIVQKEPFQYNNKKYFIDPFLISIPFGTYKDPMNISVEPKYGWSRMIVPDTPDDFKEPDETKSPEVLETSDDTKVKRWYFYIIVSLSILFGLVIYEKKYLYK